jgi:AraC family transcriptional regulator
MHYLGKIQAGIDFIENHLSTHIELTDISSHANMSHWHFQRIFKALTNETLKSYIRSRRIANSLEHLLNKQNSILDVAVASGFESHESYTRAFQRLFGFPPSKYRQGAKQKLIIRKPKFDSDYIKNLNDNVSLEPKIYHLEERHYIGIETEVKGIESEKTNIAEKLPALWDEFVPRLSEIESPIGNICYGIISQKNNAKGHNALHYLACIEVSDSSTILEGMKSMTLAAQQYAEFQHNGMVDVENVNRTISYIYSSWLLNTNMQHTFQPDIEIYGPEFKVQSEDSIIYYAIPIEATH